MNESDLTRKELINILATPVPTDTKYKIRLRGLRLRDINLEGMDLSNIEFNYAELENISFRFCEIQNTSFENAA